MMQDLIVPIVVSLLAATTIGFLTPPRATDICHNFSYEKYPYNCSKFYFVCPKANAAHYLMYCTEGLEYSAARRTCVPTAEANCHSIDGEPPSFAVPACTFLERFEFPGDCSKFYQCVDNRLFEMDCPHGYEFSPRFVYGMCVSPKLSKCGVPTTEDSVVGTTTVAIETTSTADVTSTAVVPIETTTVEPSTRSSEVVLTTPPTTLGQTETTTASPEETTATSLGSSSTTVEDSDSSTIIPIEATTTPSTTGAPAAITSTTEPASITTTNTEPPVTPSVTTEGSTTTRQEPETTTPSTEVPATLTSTTTEEISTATNGNAEAPTTQTTANPPTTSADCQEHPAINCHLAMYHPHPTDCDRFYQCSNGRPILLFCPPGLDFNVLLNVCDWPYSAQCSPVATRPCTTTPGPPATVVPSGACALGAVPCWEGIYHPHPSDCAKFCQCSNGAPYEHSCPLGLEYNAELEVCDWPEDAGCST